MRRLVEKRRLSPGEDKKTFKTFLGDYRERNGNWRKVKTNLSHANCLPTCQLSPSPLRRFPLGHKEAQIWNIACTTHPNLQASIVWNAHSIIVIRLSLAPPTSLCLLSPRPAVSLEWISLIIKRQLKMFFFLHPRWLWQNTTKHRGRETQAFCLLSAFLPISRRPAQNRWIRKKNPTKIECCGLGHCLSVSGKCPFSHKYK